MRRVFLWLAFAALVSNADAQSRPSSLALSCRQAGALVASRGAIVLGTGGFTYDRFVRDRSFCEINEYLDPAWVPTADARQCFIGYRCKSGEIEMFR